MQSLKAKFQGMTDTALGRYQSKAACHAAPAVKEALGRPQLSAERQAQLQKLLAQHLAGLASNEGSGSVA